MRSQQCRDWCRRHMWSGNSGSSLLIRSLVISLIHSRHGSIISVLNKDQFSPIGVGMNASPQLCCKIQSITGHHCFSGVGRHPVDYFSFEGTKRWWVENGPRGVWTWSGPAWAAFREALWQTWRTKQSRAIFCRCCGLHGVVCCWWLKHLNGGELAKDWEGFDLTTLGCICVGGVHGRSRVMLHQARNKVHKWRKKHNINIAIHISTYCIFSQWPIFDQKRWWIPGCLEGVCRCLDDVWMAQKGSWMLPMR